MITVSRHATDPDEALRQVEAMPPRVAKRLALLPEEPEEVIRVRDTVYELANYRCVLDPTASERETWEEFTRAAQAGAAVFAGTPGGIAEVQIGVPVRFAALGPVTNANAGEWKTAVWHAVVARDEDLVTWLCEIDADTLRASGVEHDDYMYPWVTSIRALLQRRGVTPDMFKPAMAGTDPDQARVTPKDVMLMVVYPPMKMFYYLIRRDADKFNEALASALDAHRRWWTAKDPYDAGGFVAIEPLALAILALKVGMPVTVESEYLPENLLRGRTP